MCRTVVAAVLLLVSPCVSSARAEDVSALKEPSRLDKVKRLIEEKKWGEAEGYLLAEVAENKAGSGDRKRDMNLALSMVLLAKVYIKLGRPNDAVVTLNDAVEVINRHDDLKEDEIRVHINWAYGDALHDRQEFETAQIYYERALEYADKPRPDGINPNHLKTGQILYALGGNGISVLTEYRKQGKSRERIVAQIARMESAFRRAGVIFEENLGADHEDTRSMRDFGARLQKLREELTGRSR